MAGLVRRNTVPDRAPTTPDVLDVATSDARPQTPIELFDAPFYRSIRFRLTAWYAIAMILVIIALSLSLHTLLIRALTNDAEGRLGNAARELADGIGVRTPSTGPQNPANSAPYFEIQAPSSDSIVLSGLWFQVYDIERREQEVKSSGALTEPPADLETALGDSEVFSVDSNTFKTITVEGIESLILVAPLQIESQGVPGPQVGWVVVGESLGSRDTIIEVVDQVLRLFGIVGVGLAIWGGWVMAGRALAPVGKITRTADSIANSDGTVSLSRRLDVPDSGDELSRLAFTFNMMLDRIEAAFNTQRRFVSDASHELRTPLTSVRGNVDVLLRQLKSDRSLAKADIIEELGVVRQESGRMSRLIEDMLVLARTDATSQADLLKPQAVSLDVLAREAFRTANQLANGQELKLEIDETVTLYGDGDRLVQIMIILLDNALRHTPPGGEVVLRIGRAMDTIELESCATIEVRDNGEGIAADHIPHLFERFYRAESARSRVSGGTGLGLSIALAIVRGHHGWIDVDSAVGLGTTFTVWLPLAANVDPGDGPLSLDVDSPVDKFKHRMRLMREARTTIPPTEESDANE